jgi:hypothetical protein
MRAVVGAIRCRAVMRAVVGAIRSCAVMRAVVGALWCRGCDKVVGCGVLEDTC